MNTHIYHEILQLSYEKNKMEAAFTDNIYKRISLQQIIPPLPLFSSTNCTCTG